MTSNVIFLTISNVAENYLFVYLGFTVFNYYEYYIWSFSFIGWIILFIFIGRFVSVFIITIIINLIFNKGKLKYSLKELSVIQISGMSRGILGYILSVQIYKEDEATDYGILLLENTMLMVIILMTLFFGIVGPKLIDLLLGTSDQFHLKHQHSLSDEEIN